MKKNGFTLIELLAVIVILAVIALIVTPIVTSIITSSKKSANARSVEQYVDAVNISVSSSLLSENSIQSGNYYISNAGNIEKDGITYLVKFNGTKPESGQLTINNGIVVSGKIVVNNMLITYELGKDTIVSDIVSNKIYGLEYNINNKTYTRLNDASGLNACVGTENQTCNNDFDSAEIYREMVEVTDDYGNVFIKIPKFYIKKEVSDTDLKWYVSKIKQDNDYYLPKCFCDFDNNKELDYVLVGKYDANLSDDGKRLESKKDKYPLVRTAFNKYREYALANNVNGNKGYQLIDIHVWDAIQTLFYIEFANLDSQNIMMGFSYGISQFQNDYKPISNISNTNNLYLSVDKASQFRIGQSIDISLYQGKADVALNRVITDINYDTGLITFSGTPVNIKTSMIVSNCSFSNGTTDNVLSSSGSLHSNEEGKYPMNYRGIENLYGNIWNFVDGLILDNAIKKIYVNDNSKTYSTNITSDYNEITEYNIYNNKGYSVKMGYDPLHPYIQLPILSSLDNNDSIYKDFYLTDNINEKKVLAAGGSWNFNDYCGISNYHFDVNFTNTIYPHVGSRLIKKYN